MPSNQDYNGLDGYGQQPYAPQQHQNYGQEYKQASFGKSAGQMETTQTEDVRIAPPPPPRYDEPAQQSQSYNQRGGYGEQPQQVCSARSHSRFQPEQAQHTAIVPVRNNKLMKMLTRTTITGRKVNILASQATGTNSMVNEAITSRKANITASNNRPTTVMTISSVRNNNPECQSVIHRQIQE